MKIVVLVKQTQDTEANIKIKNSQIDETNIKWIVSPYDEYAIEEAVRIKEKNGLGEVIAVSVGKERVKEVLRTAYAMGADKAVHIKVDDYNPLDSIYTAELLSSFLKSENPDIILAGRQSIDSSSFQVAVQVAEYLSIPSISLVTKLEIKDKIVQAIKEIDGGSIEVQTHLPVLITAQKGLNNPRYPNMKKLMLAKKKAIVQKLPEDLGNPSPKIEVLNVELPPEKVKGKFFETTDSQECAKNLIISLREEAKVI